MGLNLQMNKETIKEMAFDIKQFRADENQHRQLSDDFRLLKSKCGNLTELLDKSYKANADLEH